jgi:hypothetical protein
VPFWCLLRHIISRMLIGLSVEVLSSIYIRIQFVPHRKRRTSPTKTNHSMLFQKIIAVHCENHMKHINTFRELYAEFMNVIERDTYI